MMGRDSKYYRTQHEDVLLANEEHKKWVEAYAQDNELFFTNYAKAHVALSEATHDTLMCEMGHEKQDGGYVEPSQYQAFLAYWRGEKELVELKQMYRTINPEPVLKITDDHHH